MNHTCLCLPSRSWYSFTDPGGMEGWVGLGLEIKSKANARASQGQGRGRSSRTTSLSSSTTEGQKYIKWHAQKVLFEKSYYISVTTADWLRSVQKLAFRRFQDAATPVVDILCQTETDGAYRLSIGLAVLRQLAGRKHTCVRPQAERARHAVSRITELDRQIVNHVIDLTSSIT